MRHEDVLQAHLSALVVQDPSLGDVVALCDPVPLRFEAGGFQGLSRIVIGQLLSVQSAAAIWDRFCAAMGKVNAEQFLVLDEEALEGVGLSNAKFLTLRAIAKQR